MPYSDIIGFSPDYDRFEERVLYAGSVHIPDPYGVLRDPESPTTSSWLSQQEELAARNRPDAAIGYFASSLLQIDVADTADPTLPLAIEGDAHYYRSVSYPGAVRVLTSVEELSDNPVVVFDPRIHTPNDPQSYVSIPRDGLSIVKTPGVTDLTNVLYFDTIDGGSIVDEPLRPVIDHAHMVVAPELGGHLYVGYSAEATEQLRTGIPTYEPPGVYLHVRHTSPGEDVSILQDSKVYPFVDRLNGNGSPIVVGTYHYSDETNGAYVLEGDRLKTLVEPHIGQVDPVAIVDGGTIAVVTVDGHVSIVNAPVGTRSKSEWRTLVDIPKDAMILGAPLVSEGRITTGWTQNFFHNITICDLDKPDTSHVIDYPPGVSLLDITSGLAGEIFIKTKSYNDGTRVYRLDRSETVPVNIESYPRARELPETTVTVQNVKCSDGTLLPIMIYDPLEPASSQPTIVHVYGGFSDEVDGIPTDLDKALLRAGGSVVKTCIRGDGNGTDWANEGRRLGKLTAAQDAVDIARSIRTHDGITHTRTVGLLGYSNGALVASHAATMDPGAFDAVVAAFPVADMMHFKQDSNSATWVSEYGDPEHPDDVDSLMKLSLARRLSKVSLPPIMVVEAVDDSRVAPIHAHMLTAALQDAQIGNAPIVIERLRGGHEQRLLTERLELNASILGFMANHLGLEVTE